MSAWLTNPETYTDKGAGAEKCNGVSQATIASGGPEASMIACKAKCTTLLAWGMAANLPTGASAPDGANSGTATHCYGVAWNTGNCFLYPTTVVTAGAGAGTTAST